MLFRVAIANEQNLIYIPVPVASKPDAKVIDATIDGGRHTDELFSASSANISGSCGETKRGPLEVILGEVRHTEPEPGFDSGFGEQSPQTDPPLSRYKGPRRWAAHPRNQPPSPRSMHPVKEESDTRTQFANKSRGGKRATCRLYSTEKTLQCMRYIILTQRLKEKEKGGGLWDTCMRNVCVGGR